MAKKVAKKAAKKAVKKTAKKAAQKVAKAATKKAPAQKKAAAKKVAAPKKKAAPAKAKAEKTSKPAPSKAVAPAETSTTPAPVAKEAEAPKKSVSAASTPAAPVGKDAPAISVLRQPMFPIKGSSGAKKKDDIIRPAPVASTQKITPEFLEKQRVRLLELRDALLDQMAGVTQDGLRSKSDDSGGSAHGLHQADAGSDAYEKDFALSLLSQEQDALYEIEEALGRIETKTYGTCEMSGELIPVERLEARPFARYTVSCQEQVERDNHGKGRWETNPQFMKSAENFYDEDDSSDDDEERAKIKE